MIICDMSKIMIRVWIINVCLYIILLLLLKPPLLLKKKNHSELKRYLIFQKLDCVRSIRFLTTICFLEILLLMKSKELCWQTREDPQCQIDGTEMRWVSKSPATSLSIVWCQDVFVQRLGIKQVDKDKITTAKSIAKAIYCFKQWIFVCNTKFQCFTSPSKMALQSHWKLDPSLSIMPSQM